MRIQFAFMHFNNEQVKVSIDDNVTIDTVMNVEAVNERSGIADFDQVEMQNCSKVSIETKSQRLQQKICLNSDTKSIIIDGGPPLSLTQKNQFQGQD